MNAATISFLAYTALLAAFGIWSFRIVEKVPLDKYEKEFYAAGRGRGGVVVALLIAGGLASAGTFIAGPKLLIIEEECPRIPRRGWAEIPARSTR